VVSLTCRVPRLGEALASQPSVPGPAIQRTPNCDMAVERPCPLRWSSGSVALTQRTFALMDND